MALVIDELKESFSVGNLISLRGRDWMITEKFNNDTLKVRPLAGGEEHSRIIYLPCELEPPKLTHFALPDPQLSGPQYSASLMKNACRLRLRSGAGPFRSFGAIRVEPRPYQLVPLMMALTHHVVRLLIADDVGVGKTVEAALIAKEFLERGEIERFSVLCSPSLCEQWKQELQSKFLIDAKVVKPSTISCLERAIPTGQSLFEYYPFTIISLDYIKSRRYRDKFIQTCPEFVIVEEAHTCIINSIQGQHLRFELLKKLALDPERHLVFLTATPHSGNEDGFYNLLSLLDPIYKNLKDMSKGSPRETLRERLSRHFVQRRRADIKEWQDSTVFPERLCGELNYDLTPEMRAFIEKIYTLLERKGVLKQAQPNKNSSLHWLAILSLLRLAGSSPEVVEASLRKKIESFHDYKVSNILDDEDSQSFEQFCDSEWDPDDIDSDDGCFDISNTFLEEDRKFYQELLSEVKNLKGIENDGKLKAIVNQVKQLIKDGKRPIIFCRFIPTAHYLQKHLSSTLPKQINVKAVTGELGHEERSAIIEKMALDMDKCTPVLIATDCLSEGINLHHVFNTVIHYDLPWNPNRLEQREGRVDRFGQPSQQVNTVLMIGNNNPVDHAVLEVILRKADSIRSELGVQISVLEDSRIIGKALLENIFKRKKSQNKYVQLELDFGDAEEQINLAWQSAKEKAKQSRTMFSQKGLKPEEVLPEWQKMQNILGNSNEVLEFVSLAAGRLGAPLEKDSFGYRLLIDQLPGVLRKELKELGVTKNIRFSSSTQVKGKIEQIHRSHPVVLSIADYFAERALLSDDPNVAARSSAFYTEEVNSRHYLFLLRINYLLETSFTDGKRIKKEKNQLVEELVPVQVKQNQIAVLDDLKLNELLDFPIAKNMLSERKAHVLNQGLAIFEELENKLIQIASDRAETLYRDHTRVRSASQIESRKTAWKCKVRAIGRPDLLGLYVLEPVPKLV